jgi:1,4-dihydroxy-2-naphthoate octaprenyltransferase
MPLSKLKIWLQAIRPKTLPAAISPVMIGTAMAGGDGVYNIFYAAICLITAVIIQIGTNLANDYFDFIKGADTSDRVGPTRATSAGLISPNAIKWAFIFCFIVAAALSVILIERGGWVIGLIAAVSILSGILYTGGPFPLGYLGLGEIFVLIFFGPVAVAGTYYVQSLEMNTGVVLAGIAPGLISVGILTVNNLRDIDTDRKANKKTLAVRFGKTFAQFEYLFSISLAALMPIVIYIFIQDHIFILVSSISILLALPGFHRVCSFQQAGSLNEVLAFTGKLLLIFSLMFSIGWII